MAIINHRRQASSTSSTTAYNNHFTNTIPSRTSPKMSSTTIASADDEDAAAQPKLQAIAPGMTAPVAAAKPKKSSSHKKGGSMSKSYDRISRLVATVVRTLVQLPNSKVMPTVPSGWMILAAQNGVKPSAGLFALAHKLLSSAKLSLPVILMALKYLERYHRHKLSNASMCVGTAGATTPSEFGLLMACLMTANKFLDDSRYSNHWWSTVAEMPLAEVNSTEIDFLLGVSFDLHVQELEYLEWVDAMQKFGKWLESGNHSVPAAVAVAGEAAGIAVNVESIPTPTPPRSPTSLAVPLVYDSPGAVSPPPLLSASGSDHSSNASSPCTFPHTPSPHSLSSSTPPATDAQHANGGAAALSRSRALRKKRPEPVNPATIATNKSMSLEELLMKQDMLAKLFDADSPTLREKTYDLLDEIERLDAGPSGIAGSLPRSFKQEEAQRAALFPPGYIQQEAQPLNQSLPRWWRPSAATEQRIPGESTQMDTSW
ncbi:hypothetical protein HK102_013766 [Quaeritorhiza haematococci]|nr:hypothetical protein HK102_013766 [Quaeritorhiza haematococci]